MPHPQLRHIIAPLTALFMAVASPLRCVAAAPADSTLVTPRHTAPAWTGMALGAGLAATAATARQAYTRDLTIHPRSTSSHGADYLQYAPLAAPWLLKAAGVKTRSGWGRMAVSQGAAAALMAGTVKALKESVHSLRPDGSDRHSFPSGHTAWAFMGATMMARELGGTSHWYTVGAYTLATGVAIERALDSHHYPTDIIAGAGIGILSAQLGYRIGDLIFGNRQLAPDTYDLCPSSNLSYLSLQTGLSLPLGRISAGDTRLQRLPALSAALRVGHTVTDHMGIGIEVGLLSTPLVTDVRHYRTYVKSMSALSLTVTPYYIYPVSYLVSLTAEIGAGYRYNLPLDDEPITIGKSAPVGRISAGCILRLSPLFSARASIGYEVSRYRFTVEPSESYHIPAAATARGTSSALLVSISSRYEF